ncbi:hypothetical protein JAAARDRAFT_72356 [Jaapia argillacea MUCL 33604]|uniref:Uncharacterized protein n=1 Tax=Jaapia argillacea MUCL 33604 TaxID=933084 RepID=A0A067PIP3_9AGAM|nr:hypothetical protein JAAARDRAFT_72356 [Jaapia argillacea MUCL 33604]
MKMSPLQDARGMKWSQIRRKTATTRITSSSVDIPQRFGRVDGAKESRSALLLGTPFRLRQNWM